MDGQHIAGPEPEIVFRVTLIDCAADINAQAANDDPLAVFHIVADQIGLVGQGAALEPASHPHELCRRHLLGKRIVSRPKHFALNRYLGRVKFVAAKNANRVEGL